jgi:dGTPase
VDIFLGNEEKILTGNFERSLLDKCKYEAQINDIIKISISKIYQSKEVVEKEVAGYRIIADMLDVFITALNNDYNGKASNYDSLILKMLPGEYKSNIATVYQRIMSICSYIASMSDGFAIRIHKKLT